MDGGDLESELFLGCVAAMAAVDVEMSEERQVPWTKVPGRKGGRRIRSPLTGVVLPGVTTPAAKRV